MHNMHRLGEKKSLFKTFLCNTQPGICYVTDNTKDFFRAPSVFWLILCYLTDQFIFSLESKGVRD